MSTQILVRPVWTPADVVELARVAAQHQTHRGTVTTDLHYARSAAK